MKRLPCLCVALLCCMLACRHAEAQYLNSKITGKKVRVHSAVILPAKVEIRKESAKGQEMMVAESERVSDAVSYAVGQVLQQKGISVPRSPFEKTAPAMDDNRKYTLSNIQGRYDALLPKLVKNSKDVRKGRFSLGDEVMVLNVDKSADVLIFIRGQGRVFTKGKTAFSLLNPFSFDLPFVLMTVAVVDARTGEVLAFAKPLAVTKVLKDPKALNKMITKSLRKLPEFS